MYRNKIWSFDIPLLTKRIRLTLGLKRREKLIPEFEQLGQAIEEFKKAVMESYIGKFIFWILDRLEKFLEKLNRIKIF